MLPVAGWRWALTALLLIKLITTKNEWSKVAASNRIATEVEDQGTAFSYSDRPVPSLNRARRNYPPFKNGKETSLSLNRRKMTFKIGRSLSKYVITDSDACRVGQICSVPISHNTQSSLTENPAVNRSEALYRLFLVMKDTTAVFWATVPPWPHPIKLFMSENAKLKSTANSGYQSSPQTMQVVCNWLWPLRRVLLRNPSLEPKTGNEEL